MRTWSGKIRSGLLTTSRLRSKLSGQRLAAPRSRWAMPDRCRLMDGVGPQHGRPPCEMA
jgi:hypothetical protein